MAHFIKTGYWESSSLGYKGWLNVEDIVNGVITNSLAGKTININGELSIYGGPIDPTSPYGNMSSIRYDNISTAHFNSAHSYSKDLDMWDHYATNPHVGVYTIFTNSANRVFDGMFVNYNSAYSQIEIPLDYDITIKYNNIKFGSEGSKIWLSGDKTLTMNAIGGGGSINPLSNYCAQLYINTNGATVNHVASYVVDNDLQFSGKSITITNRYGLLINDFSATTNGSVVYTNKWGVYQMGTGTNNYLQGKLLIGTNTAGGSKVRISGLPTSSAGLVSGDLWNDAGTVKIIP